MVIPNPANEKILITISEEPTSSIQYQIYDLFGKMLKIGKIDGMQTEVNLSDLSEGAYFVMLRNRTQKWVQKVIIAR